MHAGSLTYDHCEDNQDDDDQNDPQLHVLPPQLPLQVGGRGARRFRYYGSCTLETKGRGGEGKGEEGRERRQGR